MSLNLNFHETFKPEKNHITELLLLADKSNNTEYTLEEISYKTGIPTGKSSGKVKPHLCYAKYMNLIKFELKNGKYSLSLTPLGKLVLEEDASLSEKITALLLHAMLIRDRRGADLWNFTFFNYKYKYGTKSKFSTFEIEANNNFLSEVNTTPLKGSYDDFFSDLNILSIDKTNNTVTFKDIGYDSQFVYLYAYVLFEYWDLKFRELDEISSLELDELNISNVFGWNKKRLYEILDILADLGVVRLNKQLSPFTVLKLTTKEDLIDKIYSELY